MVGLSVILENHRDLSEKKSPQIISKGSMTKIPPPSNGFFSKRKTETDFGCGFLEFCFLCNKKIAPGKDIYMYKGDKAFCTEECRYRQIFMDEEETNAATGCTREYNCSNSSSASSSRRGNPAFLRT